MSLIVRFFVAGIVLLRRAASLTWRSLSAETVMHDLHSYILYQECTHVFTSRIKNLTSPIELIRFNLGYSFHVPPADFSPSLLIYCPGCRPPESWHPAARVVKPIPTITTTARTQTFISYSLLFRSENDGGERVASHTRFHGSISPLKTGT